MLLAASMIHRRAPPRQGLVVVVRSVLFRVDVPCVSGVPGHPDGMYVRAPQMMSLSGVVAEQSAVRDLL